MGVPAHLRALLQKELELIAELRYEHYFLTVWDLVRFARERGILCQGRGSAANSAVCYCLGVTAVDPARIDLLFERFISRERNEPPDIDVDFEHERREEVFQYIYEKYGRERAAITAEVITYRPRSAVRDVGKSLGLSLDRVDTLAKALDWWDAEAVPEQALRAAGFAPEDRTIQMIVRLVRQLLGFPRHLSQHVGGFVITETPLCEIVPLENGAMPDRTFIEWDKDDIDALGILKVDCLALGMLTAISKCFASLQRHYEAGDTAGRDAGGGEQLGFEDSAQPTPIVPRGLADVPAEDPAVYDLICEADTVGVFQIESRAQMSMLPRLRPRCFYDLVIEVAIVRPGPIQGGMVHPFLRRRNGEEPVTYPSAAVREVLGKTLGVPLFQEQVMRLAVVAAGFSPGEADKLRRLMAAWRRSGALEQMQVRLIQGMLANGYAPEFAEQIYQQIRGFGEYGFPESHSASFALLVYVSAWLKRYHPAAFCGALLNAQPMGFYAPAQLIRDAQRHDVLVRPVDVNHSAFDCTLEHPQPQQRVYEAAPTRSAPALRLGMRLIRGLSAEKVRGVETARAVSPITSLEVLDRRPDVTRDTLLRLAAADAFRSLGLNRRQALWQILALDDVELPLLADLPQPAPPATLPALPLDEVVAQDYESLGLSLNAHPLELVRDELARLRLARKLTVSPTKALGHTRQGQRIAVAGLVTHRQRPGTAKGIVFMTLEDETGTANLIVRPQIWTRDRAIAGGKIAVIAEGTVERVGAVIHVQTQRFHDLSARLVPLRAPSRDFR
jgi:error-prone DNA polymerase